VLHRAERLVDGPAQDVDHGADDAAGAGHEVGHHDHAALVQRAQAALRHRVVAAAHHQAGADRPGVAAVDRARSGRRDDHVGVHGQERVRIDALGRAILDHAAVAVVAAESEQAIDVEAARVEDGALDRGDGDDPRALARGVAGAADPDLPEALHGDPGSVERQPDLGGRRARRHDHAEAGHGEAGRISLVRAAEQTGAGVGQAGAGIDVSDVVDGQAHVRPEHRLARDHVIAQLAAERPQGALLVRRRHRRIGPDARLRAGARDPEDAPLVRHGPRQLGDLFQGQVGRHASPAARRTEQTVVHHGRAAHPGLGVVDHQHQLGAELVAPRALLQVHGCPRPISQAVERTVCRRDPRRGPPGAVAYR
jgi:hypothetical protein